MTEVLALKYAEAFPPDREHFFVSHDPHDAPHPISYFLWLIRGESGIVVVDTGFGERAAATRNRTLLRHPVEALASVGVDANTVHSVILTHLHYDHAGTIASFPNATFFVQKRELAYATGPAMRHALCRKPFDIENMIELLRALYESRVQVVDNDRALGGGISLHIIGGHSQGLQAVRVALPGGSSLVLASDATHFYDTVLEANPFPVLCDLPDYLAGFERLFELSDDPNHVVPGHDMRVLDLFPRHDTAGQAAVLHGGPVQPTPFASVRTALL